MATNQQDPLYDVVIPFHPKDIDNLPKCIAGLRANAVRVGKIFLVSETIPPVEILRSAPPDQITWIPESIYPFTLSDVQAIVQSTKGRQGWYFQQLLKLYCFRVIPEIRSAALIFDSDIILKRPTEFFSKSGGIVLFDYSEQYNAPYYKHAARVLGPKFKKAYTYKSGITDHMLVKRDIMEELLVAIEAKAGSAMPAWRALLEAVSPADKDGSGLSEFELYFNWALNYHKSSHRLRKLEPGKDLEAHHVWAKG